MTRPMKPIPVAEAKAIAKEYGYDQVVIIARRVGEAPAPCGEHVTTYGVDPTHCGVAARMGAALKRFMGWPEETIAEAMRDIPDPMTEARAIAVDAIHVYGDLTETSFKHFRDNGIWNDHSAVQAALAAIDPARRKELAALADANRKRIAAMHGDGQ